jgi:hypothetical protein
MRNLLKISKFKGQKMAFHLVVLGPFGGFKRGDVITDSATIARIMADTQKNFVVRVSAKGA